MRMFGGKLRLILGLVVLGVIAFQFWPKIGSFTGGAGDLSREQAAVQLDRLVDDIKPIDALVDWRAKIDIAAKATIEDTLPDIDQFDLVVNPPAGTNDVAVEIFVSTEKSSSGDDGWMVDLAEAFNNANIAVSSGRTGKVRIRRIPSGTGYQFIASGKYRPDAFSPSNHLWIRMAEAKGVSMTPVREQLVDNIAGVVMKEEVAAKLRQTYSDLDMKNLVDSVVQGTITMGYTDPFASSTGLNFLVTVLQTFADGDDARLLSPEVVSAFEGFQRGVPFVALTTLQMRESVDKNGSLDAFVMEYQTFANDQSLRSGYEFIPFGAAHSNPLYAVGKPTAEAKEVLEALALMAKGDRFAGLAKEKGFDPPFGDPSSYQLPPGRLMVQAQQIWKDKKHAGRPIAAVFICDVSGSMDGTRIKGVREALVKGADFIDDKNAIGLVSFANDVGVLLPIKRFDLNHKASFVAAAQSLSVGGQTAMYDGIAVALDMLSKEIKKRPETKPMLFVLTDGETNQGLRFDNFQPIVEAMGIPVYTIGYEANLDELKRLSSLVEAASMNAGQDDVGYKIGTLLNAEM
jgi:Ca-activated chloride channel family protein